MRIPEPRAVLALTILREAGEHAYLVGGCLRDLLMGRRPKDYDIASSSSPDRTCEIFKGYKTVPSGIGYGTVTVIIDGLPLEITTFRSECGYSDGRHPDAVRFVGNVEDDLSRRDFTVNAMAYNEQEGLLDPFGGLADLKAGIIRAVGQAGERFSEDALRILRALRFCAQLGFWADPQTEGAMLDCRGGLGGVSCERIGNEVLKIVAGRYFKQAFMKYRAVFADIVPEFCEYTEKWAERVQCAADDVRLYVFFHPFENRRDIIERLRLPGRILKTSSLLSSMAETPSGTLPGGMPGGSSSAEAEPRGSLENTAGHCHAPAQEGHSQASTQSDPCILPAQDGHSQNLSQDGFCYSQNTLTSPQNGTRYSPTQKGRRHASVQSGSCNTPVLNGQALVCDGSCNALAQDEPRHTPAQEGRIQTSAQDGESMELSVFIKRILRDLSDGEFELLLDFWEALGYEVSAARREFARILAAGECCRLSALAVKGGDIAGLGYGGPKIGMVLNRCLDAVVEGRLDNRRQDILDYIKKNNMLFPSEK